MSSILKALKKLEDERGASRPDTLKIDSDILRNESSQRHSTTGVVLAALLLFAGGSVATYMFMKQDTFPVMLNNIVSEKIQSPSQSQITASTDLKTEKLPENVDIVPAGNPDTVKATISKPHKKAEASVSKQSRTIQLNSDIKYEDQMKIRNETTVQPQTASKAVPVLRVNGIAFQDGVSDSVAIVNGVPVSSGSVIEGVRVEVIQKNRVKFNYNGETFEIPLGKSNK
ncbi:MAG: hypothetical protein A2X82_17330 [Geobacteraceae bacterium GWC2_55_20]|nr:MAG: hypothetical protein A2X82_17330 [Geobacteraceae bacterium GWC2_55_20]OGU25731.1 MAG: hypothetical protein A2X85_09440 [Geobacteraceae bacterium GWF2_54_21]HBA73358.1 hypothetical protein [Geobacter sp.]HCE67484.1 hypothetical protein [Geobacter sp.]